MVPIDLFGRRLVAGLGVDADGAADDNVDGPAVGHQADIIIKQAAAVHGRQRKLEDLEAEHLEAVHAGVRLGVELVVDVVFAKAHDGDKVSAGSQRHLDEALAVLEHQAHVAGFSLERLARAANDDGDGAALAVVVLAAAAQQVANRLLGDGADAHGEDPVAVEGDAEVGVERQQAVGDAGELFAEAQGVGGKGAPGAVGDDAVRVVAHDVAAVGVEVLRLVQAHGEVVGEPPPELQRPQALRAASQLAVDGRRREAHVDEVGN